jgi:hypothetical protein
MPRKKIVVAILAALFALLLATGAQAVPVPPGTLPPYTGVIKNNTACDFSIPSQNSQGTLIVPARGWIEFVVWDPKFQVIPYYRGDPFGCQWVAVTPRAFCYMCKNYDFMVEINGPGPCPAEQPSYQKYKKRVRRKPVCDTKIERPIPPRLSREGL